TGVCAFVSIMSGTRKNKGHSKRFGVATLLGLLRFYAGPVCALGINRQFTVVTPLPASAVATPTIGLLPVPAVLVSLDCPASQYSLSPWAITSVLILGNSNTPCVTTSTSAPSPASKAATPTMDPTTTSWPLATAAGAVIVRVFPFCT